MPPLVTAGPACVCVTATATRSAGIPVRSCRSPAIRRVVSGSSAMRSAEITTDVVAPSETATAVASSGSCTAVDAEPRAA